jgi:single-stranded-DNA-specific exonuclease
MLGETGTGSARSIPGVDLGLAVRSALVEGLLIKGGGHAMAAGVTLAKDRLGDFRAFLEERLTAPVAQARASAGLAIDSAVTAAAATPALVHSIERAGPYGAGNPEPIFALPRHRLVDVMPVGADHIRIRAHAGDDSMIEGIAFRAANGPLGAALKRLRGAPVHLAGALTINRYGGREKTQLRLLDVAEVER